MIGKTEEELIKRLNEWKDNVDSRVSLSYVTVDVRMLTYLCVFLVGNRLPSIKDRAGGMASAK